MKWKIATQFLCDLLCDLLCDHFWQFQLLNGHDIRKETMLSDKAIQNLHNVWVLAESRYKVEVNGHLRENDIPVLIKLGKRKGVEPDCDIAYKYTTFHTHPQLESEYDERLMWGQIAPTIISGPDMSQLFGCNAERPVIRTELVIGEFGIVEARTTEASIAFYSGLTPQDRNLFELLIECNGDLCSDLLVFGIISADRMKYQLEHIDNRIFSRIMADKDDMQLIDDNPNTIGLSLRLYLDVYEKLLSHVKIPTSAFKVIDLTYYWFDKNNAPKD